MANEVRIDLTAKGADATARDLNKVGDAADKAGGDLKGMADDASALDQAIAVTEKNLAGLRAELAKDPEDKGLRKEVRKQERELNYLSRLLKGVQADAAEAGKGALSGIGDALGMLPAQLKSAGPAVGVGLGAAAAPLLGAAIGAAVIGGVGVGGIIGGIAAAAQDSRVQSAGEHLAGALGESFAGVGAPFVEPLIEQMGRLEGIGSAWASNLTDQLAPLAGHMDNLVDGVAGFARNLDLSKAVDAAGPLLDVIGDELPEVASAATDALNSIAEESDGLAAGLKTTFDVMETGIRVTGSVIGALAATHEAVVDLSSAVGDLSDEYLDGPARFIFPWLIPLAEGLSNAGDKTDEYTQASIRGRDASIGLAGGLKSVADEAQREAEKLDELNEALDELLGNQLSVDQASVGAAQGMRDLLDNLKEGRRTLNENTEAGAENREGVLSQISAWERLRDAQIRQTGSITDANNAFRGNLDSLEDTLLQLGYNRAEVDKLVGAYRRLIDAATEASIAANFGGYIGSDGKAVIGERHGADRRASGGPVMAGRNYIVGENGPELVTFGANGMVHNATDTKAILGSAGPSGQATTINLIVKPALGVSSMERALVEWMLRHVRFEIDDRILKHDREVGREADRRSRE